MKSVPTSSALTEMATFPFQLVANGRAQPFSIAEGFRRNVQSRPGAPREEILRWMEQNLCWHGLTNVKSARLSETILDALVAIGDVGAGSAFGQTIIVPTRARHVLLPGGEVVRIGGTLADQIGPQAPDRIVRRLIATDSEVLEGFENFLGHPVFLDFQIDDQLLRYERLAGLALRDDTIGELDAWVKFASEYVRIDSRSGFSIDRTLPFQVRRALIIAGALNVVTEDWHVTEEMAHTLNEWVGAPSEISTPLSDAVSLDADQTAIICAKPNARLVVEAGPGSGKTHVACERIVHLIRNDVAPSRIWLLSFTKIAVEEIRQRIATALEDSYAASAVNVATFDSFAWQLNSAFTETVEVGGRSYEQSIRDVILLLQSGDMALSDFIGSLEHVVVDEAQDLVGGRHVMVDLFLNALPDHCGVTILGDFAQAIYGWQDRTLGNSNMSMSRESLLDQRDGFVSVQLRTDHRTKSPQLAELFRSAREVLRDTGLEPRDRYDRLRALIEDAASRQISGLQDPRFPTGSNSLVLYRGRKPLLATGYMLAQQQRKFRIKLSNGQAIIMPWVGALLAGVGGSSKLRRNDVSVLLQDLPRIADDLDEENVWNDLVIISRSQQATLQMSEICDRIERGLPVRFLKKHVGAIGPLLSTIHGAKGQEADRVVLMLPGRPQEDSEEVEWDEEAKVLFVGATRAREELMIGSQWVRQMRMAKSGRRWRGRLGNFSAEIGLPGDVSLLPDNSGTQPESQWLRATAERLLGLGDLSVEAVAMLDAESGRYGVFASTRAGDEAPVCYLSDSFIADVCHIAGCAITSLPERIDNFSIMGCTTQVWRSINGTSGVALAPILTGFSQISIGGN